MPSLITEVIGCVCVCARIKWKTTLNSNGEKGIKITQNTILLPNASRSAQDIEFLCIQ